MKCKIYYEDGTIFEGEWNDAPCHKDETKVFHREDGPAIEWANGDRHWYLKGRHHRVDGPAVEKISGSTYWYLNGRLHREGGPAIDHADGNKEWYLNNRCHREDGPAIEWNNGISCWYQNDVMVFTLSQDYLIRYMELTGETLTTLLLHPDQVVRESVKKYKWN